MTLQVWQSKRKLGFETSRNMDLEKYVRACERASLDNTRLKEIFAKNQNSKRSEREKLKSEKTITRQSTLSPSVFLYFLLFFSDQARSFILVDIKLVLLFTFCQMGANFGFYQTGGNFGKDLPWEKEMASNQPIRKRITKLSLWIKIYVSWFSRFKIYPISIHGPNLFKVCKKCFSSSVCPGN